MTYVHVAASVGGNEKWEPPRCCRSHSYRPDHGPGRNLDPVGRRDSSTVHGRDPETWFREVGAEESESRNVRRPSPALGGDIQNGDDEFAALLDAFDVDRARARIDRVEVKG